ncbi:GNAT family N-acetyltransferase [Pseudactinotalea terrae]|uniref:GNAT family N-acetyltransferase n=1 Tax=Pseudactinotalea terrae TaxID=1743262 RepID=UPI0012E0D010|nr:GNAT family N-acetyltransferase [Pseudactinotalea terrae]
MKRAFDVLVSVLALVALSPILVAISVVVAATSPGGSIFRQQRVGRHGVHFDILKFRTMQHQRFGESQLTIGRDPRITRVGAFLRSTKLDELPQLINVVRGEMSLVGPRPEVPQYVALWPEAARGIILSVRPGITDPASIELRAESAILADQDDPAAYYEEVLIPQKVDAYLSYVSSHSLLGDIKLIVATLAAVAVHTREHITEEAANELQPAEDEATTLTFRPLEPRDARAAAAIHADAFPSFFLSDLGARFLAELYTVLADDPGCISVVAQRGRTIIGVASGPAQSRNYLASLAKRHFIRFALAALPRVAAKPSLIPRVARRLRSVGPDPSDYPALLSSICVSRRTQGRGVGRRLLAEWTERMHDRGATRIHLTTDRDANERTIGFYEGMGWTVSDAFETREGRRMLVMTLELEER